MADQPERIPLDHVTSDQLDRLYERLAELENDAAITAKVMAQTDEDTDGAREVARYFKHRSNGRRRGVSSTATGPTGTGPAPKPSERS